jgi:hypothetical protein
MDYEWVMLYAFLTPTLALVLSRGGQKPHIGYNGLMRGYQNKVISLAGDKQKGEVQLVVNLFQSVLDGFIRGEIKKEEAEPAKVNLLILSYGYYQGFFCVKKRLDLGGGCGRGRGNGRSLLVSAAEHFKGHHLGGVGIFKAISCNSTHFAMERREHFAVLKLISCNSMHFAMTNAVLCSNRKTKSKPLVIKTIHKAFVEPVPRCMINTALIEIWIK